MLTGAIVGAVGSLINRGVSFFEVKQKSIIDEKKRSDEIELAKITAGKDSIVASFQHDTSLADNASQWVCNIRALMRPFITIFFLFTITMFFFCSNQDDKSIIIATTLDAATMVITWWFADRVKR